MGIEERLRHALEGRVSHIQPETHVRRQRPFPGHGAHGQGDGHEDLIVQSAEEQLRNYATQLVLENNL